MRAPPPASQRGRGRPARTYAVTDAGRAAFPHAYDELATTALRYLRAVDGEAGVQAFAEHRADVLERELGPRCRARGRRRPSGPDRSRWP